MPIMREAEWASWSKRGERERRMHERGTSWVGVDRSPLVAERALRDLLIIANFVDPHGHTVRPEVAVVMLMACGMPNAYPLQIGATIF